MDACRQKSSKYSLFVCLVLSLCVTTSSHANEWVYSVVKGDTLSEFSEKYLYRISYWKQLQSINNIQDPKRIPENTKLRVPISWIRTQPAAAKLVETSGNVQFKQHQQDIFSAAESAQKIQLGDELKTGPQSSALIRFADGSDVLVLQNSLVSFNHMTAYGDTGMVDSRIRLLQGDVQTQVEKQQGGGSRFEIHTPAAVSAVRGTEFRISFSEQSKSSSIEVLEGGVAVRGGKTTRLIKSGYGTRVEKDKTPLKPKKLLEPPALKSLPVPIEQIGAQLNWSKDKQARSYRALISTTENFSSVLWDQTSERNNLTLPDLKDGDYFLQLRSIDQHGIQGKPWISELTLNARPQPPFPMLPNKGAVIRGETPQLEWTNSEDAESYMLEIATDEGFTQLISKEQLSHTLAQPSEATEPGTYFWRLASIATDGEQGPYSDIRSLTVKPIPATPSPTLEQDDKQVRLSWSEGLPGQSYQVQIARNRDFTTILEEHSVLEPELSMPRPEGFRYVRVRTLDDDGYAGGWGVTQEILPPPSDSWIYVFGSFVMTIILL
ncbi:FecR domain-containing protein [Neptuniibacter sp.]|uniref:FecR domain-containing protein n=1 Tax=Neptuniibacter sp. TaxID=1962643 RepID=UPI002616EED2|nr:FecR domain-containing protein [Neptuniibacter sp.]MCP4595224.1 LysM peptidoglycan-binding domain-containing protein [Neptuniibacter sp.]